MPIGKNGAVHRRLQTLFNVGSIRELSDGQLLERFATDRGEPAELAFAALVERHGAMVLRVCRGVLADQHDAQDAFQATFLVLVRKARALWVRESLGPWLYQVAYRTAACARSAAARRRWVERQGSATTPESRATIDEELLRALYEEIDRLPERYRAPLVLCDLERQTYEQAARHLGWPIGTVKSRLARARDRLRERLHRRGFARDAGVLAPAPGAAGPASISSALVDGTTSAAVRFATAHPIVPGSAASLAQGVLRSMFITRFVRLASVLVILGGAAASGIELLAQQGTSSAGPRPDGEAQAAPGNDPSLHVVKRGKLKVTLVERGLVEPSHTDDVFCRVPGSRVILSIVPEGAQVKQGELVCELESSDLRAQLTTLVLNGNGGAEAATLQKQIENCTLLAPADGTVVHANDPSRFGGSNSPQIGPGKTVRERQLIFRLFDLAGPMRVKTGVRESMVDQLKPGMPARTRIDALPGEVLPGTVQEIAPLPNATSFGEEIKRYTTRVSLDKRLPGIRPGLSAEVEILIADLDNVLTVPLGAVLYYEGKDRVAVKQAGGGWDWREITPGGRTDTVVEVKEGLQSGERVHVNPISLLSAREKRAKLGTPARPATKGQGKKRGG